MDVSRHEDHTVRPFHWRGLTSFLVTLGFLMLAVTGVALYFTPQGRVAHWTGWRMAGLDKDQWAAVHMLSGLLFLIAAGFHLYFNWEVLVHYIKTKSGLHLKLEMVLALIIAVILVSGTLMELPPFQYVVDVNDRIKNYWEARSVPAPYPHAEASTLEDFAKNMSLPLEDLKNRLADLGLSGVSSSMTVKEASDQLELSPITLYKRLGYSVLVGRLGRGSAGFIRGTGSGVRATGMDSFGSPFNFGGGRRGDAGSGWGWQSLRQVCRTQEIDLQLAIDALASNGIRADGDDKIRDLANEAQLRPSEIISMIRGNEQGSGRWSTPR